MEPLEKGWNIYPVLHIDFSMTKYTEFTNLTGQLNLNLLRWEEELYGKNEVENTPAERFIGVIQRAYKQTGKPVVVLIDEYDAPMLDSNHHLELQDKLRKEMREFFQPVKGSRAVSPLPLLTGISKFGRMSIFSELNNLQNISMNDDYSAICGITERELHTQLKVDCRNRWKINKVANCHFIYFPYSLSIKSLRPILRNSLIMARRSSGLYQKKNIRWASFSFCDLAEKTG